MFSNRNFRLISNHEDIPYSVERLELQQARRALHLLKRLIGPDELIRLLKPELSRAPDFWRGHARKSGGILKPSEVEIEVPGLKVDHWYQWFLLKAAVNQEIMLAANPEHYQIVPLPGKNGMSITEALGGVVSKFEGIHCDADMAPVALDPRFTHRIIVSCRLEDGTELGRVLHQFRDTESGLHMKLSVYFPTSVPDQVLRFHREHLIVEFGNWIEGALAEVSGS